MEKEVKENYIKAGKIHKEVSKFAKKEIKVGSKLLDVAEKIENKIVELEGKCAFPVNLSRNDEAAHYTPKIGDELEVDEKTVLKVDIGVHIDGFIADSAFTLDFTNENGKLVETSEKALQNVLSILKVGLPIKKIGEEIENTIKKHGFKPISNLSGHGLGQYLTHVPPTIPNTSINSNQEVDADESFAIEPFATSGSGLVHEVGISEIFSIDEPKPVRNMQAREILENAMEEYLTLPFAERWFGQKYSEFQRKVALRELVSKKCFHPHPVLKDKEGSMISQCETSVIFDDEELIILVKK